MSARVRIERSEGRNRIEVRFPFDRSDVAAIKRVTGARWSAADKMWTVPCTLRVCHELRREFGRRLSIGSRLGEWARASADLEQRMWEASKASDAELLNVPAELSSRLRPYQRAGVSFIARSNAPLIADQMGLGKTIQLLASLMESGMIEGSHLIVAPKTAVETGVWSGDISKFGIPGEVYEPTGGRATRERTIRSFLESDAKTKFIVVNPAMVRLKTENVYNDNGLPIRQSDGKLKKRSFMFYPELGSVQWTTVTVDECHRDGTRNPSTQVAKGLGRLKSQKRHAVSGTPITNRPIDLWGTLNFLDPDVFGSKWAWADQWLVITDNGYGKDIGNIKPGLEEELFRSLSPYLLRRKKTEVAEDMPEKEHIDVWCDMEPSQKKVYMQFARDAEIKMSDMTLSATNILSELTRLKQFAGAPQSISQDDEGNMRLQPDFASGGKRQHVEEIMEELGVIEWQGGKVRPCDGEEKLVIFSQFTSLVEGVVGWLGSLGVETVSITGKTSGPNRKAAVEAIQHGTARVIVMNTQAGGTAITLDRASTVVFLDETWSPADQEQAEDRCHRISRPQSVTVYTLRSKGTVEETIMARLEGKRSVHKMILDDRREMKLW